MSQCARDAVALLPAGSSLDEIVQVAVKLNVFSTMKQLLVQSPILADAARRGDVRIDGVVYDIRSGGLEWLGEHPELPGIIDTQMPFWQWRMRAYEGVRGAPTVARSGGTELALQRLQRGNQRFVDGEYTPPDAARADAPEPYAIVVGAGVSAMPPEALFDAHGGGMPHRPSNLRPRGCPFHPALHA